MEYDILEKGAWLIASDEGLDERLKEAARLVIASFPSFDECLIYVWNDKGRRLDIRAHHAKDGAALMSRVESYGEGEGLAGAAALCAEYTEANAKAPFPEGASFNGVEDRGLAGFRSVLVWPLKDTAGLYGVMYLKSRKKAALTARRKRLLSAAAMLAAMAIKFEWLARSRRLDRDEIKTLQMKLANAERLMALGDMAASIAHEIRNPLVSLGGFALRLKTKLGPDSPHIRHIDVMLAEVAKIEKTINGALRYSRDSLLEMEPGDLSEIIEDTAAIFEDDFNSRGIEVIKDLHKGPLPVSADREQLKIAFDNLIANAIQSMEQGGTLRLTTRKNDTWAVAEVADSGGGIEPRHLAHIFNPFFTTKDDGTGLGLPITNSIIMRHKGVIDVINNAGVGVTFAVKLPLAEGNN